MQTTELVCLAAMGFAIAGCGYRTSFTPTNIPPHEMHARAPATVELLTASRPTRPFVEVGLLSSGHAGAYSLSTDEEVMLGLREKAAEVGCDAVLVEAETTNYVVSSYSTGANTASATTEALKKFRAACILYTDAAK
jgi:hypothetical protein